MEMQDCTCTCPMGWHTRTCASHHPKVMVASIGEIIRLTAHVVEHLRNHYAVPSYVYDAPWFSARLHTYADRKTDPATAAFLIANEVGRPRPIDAAR